MARTRTQPQRRSAPPPPVAKSTGFGESRIHAAPMERTDIEHDWENATVNGFPIVEHVRQVLNNPDATADTARRLFRWEWTDQGQAEYAAAHDIAVTQGFVDEFDKRVAAQGGEDADLRSIDTARPTKRQLAEQANVPHRAPNPQMAAVERAIADGVLADGVNVRFLSARANDHYGNAEARGYTILRDPNGREYLAGGLALAVTPTDEAAARRKFYSDQSVENLKTHVEAVREQQERIASDAKVRSGTGPLDPNDVLSDVISVGPRGEISRTPGNIPQGLYSARGDESPVRLDR